MSKYYIVSGGFDPIHVRQKFPETVLLVSVIEIVFPGFYGWERAEDEDSAVFIIDRLEGVGYVFVFHVVTSYRL